MRDQADQLRQLVRQTVKAHPVLEPGVPLVVVSGGQDGVGVTTVATQLVEELALLGKRSVLVDAHPLRPDVATHFGEEVHGSLAEVLDGSRSAVEVLQSVSEWIQLLPGRWATDSPPEMGREAILRLLAELRTLDARADIVVVDVGSGMSPWVQHFWKAASQVLLITTEEPSVVMDSYAAIKLAPWAEVDGKVRLVVNRCDDRRLSQRIADRFAETCHRFLGLDVASAPTVACREETRAMTQRQLGATANNLAFHQSIRLLAAEVIGSCLVVSGFASNHSTTVRRVLEPSEAQARIAKE